MRVGSKDARALIDAAQRAGWSTEYAGSGHVKLRSPKGKLIVISSTSKSLRGIRNARAQLRRQGVNI